MWSAVMLRHVVGVEPSSVTGFYKTKTVLVLPTQIAASVVQGSNTPNFKLCPQLMPILLHHLRCWGSEAITLPVSSAVIWELAEVD